jgi:hypothetical protein
MHKNNKLKKSFWGFVFGLTALLALVGFIGLAFAGALEPPASAVDGAGNPVSTMRTLDEVEPRTPISSLPFIISASGSYYLSQDLIMGTVGGGMLIAADNVTLDLNGFALIGAPGSTNGIAVNDPQKNIFIRNGTIRDWGDDGVSGLNARNSRLENLQVSDNLGAGLKIGWGSVVTNCTTFNNTDGGVVARDNSVVTNCTADSNGGNGITVGLRSVVTNCSVSFNGGEGIEAGAGSKVSGCVAGSNTANGIKVTHRCYLISNNCISNGLNGDGAGIVVTGNSSRIEGNNVIGNDRGIEVTGILNIIIKNTVGGVDSYTTIGPNNNYGPIVNVGGGVGDISSRPNSDHPWANFQL